MPQTERGMMAAFETVCERLGRLEALVDLWLCRERDREVDKGGRSTVGSWDGIGTLPQQGEAIVATKGLTKNALELIPTLNHCAGVPLVASDSLMASSHQASGFAINFSES